ncbi:MAG: hypothetical protein KFF73_10100 [Cyclobacteriaceae bacterium]|nr:hypothetical protein [Cyclobacteriaceae bacterium]
MIFLHMGCSSKYTDTDEEMMGYAYFPLEPGNYRIFEVVDIRYTIQNQKDTSIYYIKQTVMDSSVDQAGEIAWYIYVYKSENPSPSWEEETIRVQQVKKSRTNLVLYEDNVPFVKLTFPVKSGLTWDGNVFNTSDPQFYYYADQDLPEGLPELEAGQLIRVVQNEYDDQILQKDIRYEIYAEHIGLVYKEIRSLEYCREPSCLGEEEVITGRELFQSMIEYGNE